MRIEAVKEKVVHLPLHPKVLASLRETARRYTTHYSTMIEGNRLEPEQIDAVLEHAEHFPGRERDEREVKSYYSALQQVEKWVVEAAAVSEKMIQKLHALVMAEGKTRVKASAYRTGQNVIRDSNTRRIIYLPPEAKDVPGLMAGLVEWVTKTRATLPCPIIAGITHYQIATIHPYYDGNGRTARLLTTFILHRGGYGLKGLYALEEYYARDLNAYYEAISIGTSHNYYEGRAEADITPWIEYFIEGMAVAFEHVLAQMNSAIQQGLPDQTDILRTLDPRKRKALELFEQNTTITAKQIGDLFGFKPRTSAQLCKNWVEDGFLEIADFSNKGRKYRLARQYEKLVSR